MAVPDKVVPYRYYNVIRNCGDAITADILSGVLGVTGKVVDGSKPHLLGIGSIFFMATPHSHIWGSGVLNPANALPGFDPAKIHALRGALTREHLRSLGHRLPDVPLGDPGVLVDGLMQGFTPQRRYRAAVVPHHSSFHSRKYDAFRGSEEFCLVDMMDDSRLPLEQIAAADVVISQSLHGLIFAEALGKPNLWVSDNASPAWTFKFRDWYSTTEAPQAEPAPLSLTPEEMLRQAARRGLKIDRAALKAAFPHQLAAPGPEAGQDAMALRALSPLQIFVEEALSAQPPEPLIRRLRALRALAFRDVPEPTYLAVLGLGAGRPPSRAELLAAQRHLDLLRESDFVWFLPPGAEAGEIPPGLSRAKATLGESSLPAGSVLLRPNGAFSAASKFSYFRPAA
ncbi:polysaccharide pyruvyl transferase family protein [Pseudoroseomonas cervicalis]|uniref:polysaccharide pyruvyl transferase family protein n=1 Tax=Teichococcus cervicalis TaxID=204525 RepID=UPI002785EBEA|nr:polysaccharide pyruvyl transferase family protein [Pseudoroseomonas cervicalis]MDQ1077669.1 hypothetical protein [Pseudoroseomonas cervicalis]